MENDFLELKNEILKISRQLDLFIPKEFTVAQIAKTVGKTKQAVDSYLRRHYEPYADFYKKGNKILVQKDIAIEIIQRMK